MAVFWCRSWLIPRNVLSLTLPTVIATPLDVAVVMVSLTPEESQQVGADLILLRRREAMVRARTINLLGDLGEAGRISSPNRGHERSGRPHRAEPGLVRRIS